MTPELGVYRGETVKVLERGPNLSRIVKVNQNEDDFSVRTEDIRPVPQRRPRRYTSYLDQFESESRDLPTDFWIFVDRLRRDENLLITYSASSVITEEFRINYTGRAETELREDNHDVAETTQGNKLNVICSTDIVDGLSVPGIHFEPFFGGATLVVAHGERAELWWALIDCGFRQGVLADQDQNRITEKLAIAFEKNH